MTEVKSVNVSVGGMWPLGGREKTFELLYDAATGDPTALNFRHNLTVFPGIPDVPFNTAITLPLGHQSISEPTGELRAAMHGLADVAEHTGIRDISFSSNGTWVHGGGAMGTLVHKLAQDGKTDLIAGKNLLQAAEAAMQVLRYSRL